MTQRDCPVKTRDFEDHEHEGDIAHDLKTISRLLIGSVSDGHSGSATVGLA